MLSVIIWAIVIYCLIRFVVNFVIPVFQVTRKMKEQVRDFNSRMQTPPGDDLSQQSSSRKPEGKTGDYIDFEEIK